MSYAAILLLRFGIDDKNVVNTYFRNRYSGWVKNNLYANGTTTDLMGRDAFAYHSYDLLFFAEICHGMACYEGYKVADEFYAQDVNWGASIKKSVDSGNLIYWTRRRIRIRNL